MSTAPHALAHVQPPALNPSHHTLLADGPSVGTIAGTPTDYAAPNKLVLPARAQALDIEVASLHEVSIVDGHLRRLTRPCSVGDRVGDDPNSAARVSPLTGWRLSGIVSWTVDGTAAVHGGGGDA